MTILPARSCIIMAFGTVPITCQNRRAPAESPTGSVIGITSIQGRRFRRASQAHKRALRLRVVSIPGAPRPDVHDKCGKPTLPPRILRFLRTWRTFLREPRRSHPRKQQSGEMIRYSRLRRKIEATATRKETRQTQQLVVRKFAEARRR